MRYAFAIHAAFAAVLVAGCSANHNSIHRVDRLRPGEATVLHVDAKQRSLITNLRTQGQEATRQFCSEPSPDVYSVLAQAFGAGASFGQSADPKTLEAAFNLAYSSSETGTAIAKTQSVNLMRDLLFRTCERYINGSIDGLEMSIQAARDQRIIVSLLAIEQLTGAVAPKPVVIGSAGSAGAGAGPESLQTLDQARTRRDTARKAAKDKTAAYDAENKDGACEADDASEDKKKTCAALQQEMANAKAARQEADEFYDAGLRMARTGGVTAGITTGNSGTGGLDRVSPEALAKVAGSVERIVAMNADTDEFLFFCIRQFSDPKFAAQTKALEASGQGSTGDVAKLCVDYIKEGIKSDIEQRFDSRLYQAERATIAAAAASNFDKFWAVVSTDDKLDQAKLAKAVAAVSAQSYGKNRALLAAMKEGKDKDDVAAAFAGLTLPLKRRLAGEKEN